MEKKSKIYVAGHTGLVGSAIVRELKKQGFNNLLLKTHKELDLLNFQMVSELFQIEKPDFVFMAAAKVGGICANSNYPANFIFENLQVQNNIIYNAHLNKINKLLFLGSSCIYPRNCPQPIKEEYLLTSELEKTNEPYAIAKIAGIKLCQSFNKQYNTNFIAAMPTNIYGPGDNFHPENSHVIPGLIHKIHTAKTTKASQVILWGTGKPYREFLYTDDLANACIFLMNTYNEKEIINIGSGKDLTIKELAEIICKVVDYKGKICFDPSKPDGTPRKLLDITKIRNLGWKPYTELKTGLTKTYEWYLKTNQRKVLTS